MYILTVIVNSVFNTCLWISEIDLERFTGHPLCERHCQMLKNTPLSINCLSHWGTACSMIKAMLSLSSRVGLTTAAWSVQGKPQSGADPWTWPEGMDKSQEGACVGHWLWSFQSHLYLTSMQTHANICHHNEKQDFPPPYSTHPKLEEGPLDLCGFALMPRAPFIFSASNVFPCS